MKAIGIDIGTTTICGILMDAVSGTVLMTKTLPNNAALPAPVKEPYARLQDPEKIHQKVYEIYQTFLQQVCGAADISCIGLTGQMHGILYVDDKGQAVSPLYTWQDERGREKTAEGSSYVTVLSQNSGYPLASGYGMVTHFVLQNRDEIPKAAISFCTIQDYIGMSLTGRMEPLVHPSNAASFGCFDFSRHTFDESAAFRAGIATRYFPSCQDGCFLLGHTKEGIPVAAGIGDNQASFLGSVRSPEDSVLINVGTGSQISIGLSYRPSDLSDGLRPLNGDNWLLTGASLCGGRAYAALEQFFRKTVEILTGGICPPLYEQMEQLLQSRKETTAPLKVHTQFCGTRKHPEETASIQNLTLENFLPEELTYGILDGIAEELFSYHQKMLAAGIQPPQHLIGSGNGIRKNRSLQKIFEKKYGLPMQIPLHREEAAYGAALYGLTAAGWYPDLKTAQQLISYSE